MIIGIVGPIASGKSIVSDMLVKKGFVKLSFSAEVRAEATKRGILIERKQLQDLGNLLREQEGDDYWARRVIAQMQSGMSYVVEGIRHPAEVTALRALPGFVLIGVTAPLEQRYQWIMMRGKDSDPASLEGVRTIDARDQGSGEGSHGQQSAAAFQLADYTLVNDMTKEKLEQKIHMLLRKLGIESSL